MTSDPCDCNGCDEIADVHLVDAYVCVNHAEEAHHLGLTWVAADHLVERRRLQYLAARLHVQGLERDYELGKPTAR